MCEPLLLAGRTIMYATKGTLVAFRDVAVYSNVNIIFGTSELGHFLPMSAALSSRTTRCVASSRTSLYDTHDPSFINRDHKIIPAKPLESHYRGYALLICYHPPSSNMPSAARRRRTVSTPRRIRGLHLRRTGSRGRKFGRGGTQTNAERQKSSSRIRR